MKPFLIFLSTSILITTFSNISFSNPREKILQESLEYLDEIPEIKWVKFKRTDVVIGWKGLPNKFSRLNREAAIKASRALAGKVHVWSVRHSQKTWIIGTQPYICSTIARIGKVMESSCRF